MISRGAPPAAASGGMRYLLGGLLDAFGLGPIGPLAWRQAGDVDGRVIDPRRGVSSIVRERMLEKCCVVAGGVAIQALVRAARLAPIERRMGNRLGHVELIAKLDGGEPFGVPDARAVVEAKAPVALLELGESVARGLHLRLQAIDAVTRLHAARHLVTQGRKALGAALRR